MGEERKKGKGGKIEERGGRGWLERRKGKEGKIEEGRGRGRMNERNIATTIRLCRYLTLCKPKISLLRTSFKLYTHYYTSPSLSTLRQIVRMYVRYFSQKTGRRTAVSLCTYGDRPGIDRCTYGVRTGVVCFYLNLL